MHWLLPEFKEVVQESFRELFDEDVLDSGQPSRRSEVIVQSCLFQIKYVRNNLSSMPLTPFLAGSEALTDIASNGTVPPRTYWRIETLYVFPSSEPA